MAYCIEEEFRSNRLPKERVRSPDRSARGPGQSHRCDQQAADEDGSKGHKAQPEIAGAVHGVLRVRHDYCWYQKLVAEKYDGSQYRSSPDQPQITKEIVNLVLRKLRPPASSPGG